MDNTIECPHCGKSLSDAPELIGQPVLCPYCQQQFLISPSPAVSSDSPPATYPEPVYVPAPPPSPRPAGVTAIGIIGVILGSLGVLGTTCMGMALLAALSIPDIKDQLGLFLDDALTGACLIATIIAYFFLGLALLLSCIGLLKGKIFGRRAFLILAVFFIITGLLAMVGLVTAGDGVNTAGTIVGCLINLTYYLISLIYLRQPRVKAYFT